MAPRTREIPALHSLGGLVSHQVRQEGSANWNDPVLLGLGLPHDAVDRFGSDTDHATVEINIINREP